MLQAIGPPPATGGTEQNLKKTVDFAITIKDVYDEVTVRPSNDSESDIERLERSSGLLRVPRMSLLGRPLHYRVSRRDARYRRTQSRVYNFLERPSGLYSILYHIILFTVVFACLILSIFSTIEEYEELAGGILFYMEIIVLIWFLIEFGLRLWSSGCRSRYQGRIGRLKFLRQPFCLIDVVTIAASFVVICTGSSGQVFAASAIRGLRFFQILRMVRMDRRGGTWKLLGSVVYAHRQELITTLYIGFLGLILTSSLIYMVEKEVNNKGFPNYAYALWWGVVTLSTVGYGDTIPATWQGKLIASFCALLGITFFALPAGILGSGFALKVQQQQRQKHMIRRRQPAATLIQCAWRCYSAEKGSSSTATWKIHEMPIPSPQMKVSSTFKHNTSFVSRLPSIRRLKGSSVQSRPNPKEAKGGDKIMLRFTTPSVEKVGTGLRRIILGHNEESVAETTTHCLRSTDDEDDELQSMVLQQYRALTDKDKSAVQVIRKIKYLVARRKFKEALKPYDLKDVIEQYSAGHVDLLSRVKSIQNRLDQVLGKPGSKAKDVYASRISLASRVVKVERQVDDIEGKIDQFMEIYMEDRRRILSLPIATEELTGTIPKFKSKSILVEKNYSEPATSISMLDDLNTRVRKTVTLSSPYDEEGIHVIPAKSESTTSLATCTRITSVSTDAIVRISDPQQLDDAKTDASETNIAGTSIQSLTEDCYQELCIYPPAEIIVTQDTSEVIEYSTNVYADVHLLSPHSTSSDDIL